MTTHTLAHNFLDTILEATRLRVRNLHLAESMDVLRARAVETRRARSSHTLHQALSAALMNFKIIAEYKRASPSKGVIRDDLTAVQVAQSYQRGFARAVSVLTEEDYFKGSLADLRAVRESIALPVLRKDFIVDRAQIYEAAEAGADAVLLIVAALDDARLADLRAVIEDELGMDALIEVHTSDEMKRAARCGARIIGVNNRNLETFHVTLETSLELVKRAPRDALLISESGLTVRDDLARLRDAGYDAFLIGESLMRAPDTEAALRELL
ncbi:MAG: indole-3-glycerol phosphate synthase TrpC [Pyrinomonadaceae bacterium MAG19_C2-C3]|nr:indole-3-glycerol phosphate synthase TrpC [Pyrinomonadaceae bacterium MAG19_C2-C3]